MIETAEVRGERVGRAPRPSRRYAAGRVCAAQACGTRLSIYNPDDLCWRHRRPHIGGLQAGAERTAA